MMWQGPGGTIHPAANADNTVFTYQSNYNHRVGGTRDGCAGMVVPLHRDCGCDCEWRDKYQSLLQQLQQVLQQRSPP